MTRDVAKWSTSIRAILIRYLIVSTSSSAHVIVSRMRPNRVAVARKSLAIFSSSSRRAYPTSRARRFRVSLSRSLRFPPPPAAYKPIERIHLEFLPQFESSAERRSQCDHRRHRRHRQSSLFDESRRRRRCARSSSSRRRQRRRQPIADSRLPPDVGTPTLRERPRVSTAATPAAAAAAATTSVVFSQQSRRRFSPIGGVRERGGGGGGGGSDGVDAPTRRSLRPPIAVSSAAVGRDGAVASVVVVVVAAFSRSATCVVAADA